jgi:hypothetical protein
MQRVEIAIGDPVQAGPLQEMFRSLVDSGILSGFELSASAADTISLNAGVAFADSGVFIVETEQQFIPFTLTVAPANFTVYYQYTPNNNFGGQDAILSLQPGLVPALGFTNGVVLGWIQYPGGSVPLDPNSMFLSAPRLRLSQDPNKLLGEFNTVFAPLSTRWSLLSLTGPAPVISESYNATYKAPVTQLTNAGLVISRSSYVLPFRVPREGIGMIQAQLLVSSGAVATFTLLDSQGNTVTPLGFNFYTNVPMQISQLRIPYAAGLVPNSEMLLQISLEINPSFSVILQSLGISSYTDPF